MRCPFPLDGLIPMSGLSARHQEANAQRVAAKFVNSARRRSQIRDISSTTGALLTVEGRPSCVFWYSERELLFEYPILDQHGKMSGYVISSGSRRAPPIIEYSLASALFSTRLFESLEQADVPKQRVEPPRRWIYFGPFDIVAELEG